MHDRHSGGGVEIGAVHIEEEEEEEEEEPEEVSCVVADRETVAEEPDQVSCVVADHGTAAEEDPDKVNSCVVAGHEMVVAQGVAIPLQVATLNMHLQSPGEWFLPLIHDYDVVCLQEVTAECLNDLVAVGKARGFHVVSPLQRGQVSAESFDVCLLLNSALAVCKISFASTCSRSCKRRFRFCCHSTPDCHCKGSTAAPSGITIHFWIFGGVKKFGCSNFCRGCEHAS